MFILKIRNEEDVREEEYTDICRIKAKRR